MPIDMLQTDDGDLKLVNGDIVWGESTNQHMRDILLARKGDIRTRPGVGVDSESFLSDDYKVTEEPGDLYREIRLQFIADGMKVNRIFLQPNNRIFIDAKYNNG